MKEILSYNEMCQQEVAGIQRGMNYRPQDKNYSIFLMSTNDNAPYNDGFDEDKNILRYEGEDVTKKEAEFPKEKDQPLFTKTGKLTNNGKFFKRAEKYKLNRIDKPEQIRVYEKLEPNVWTDKGWFELVDALYTQSEHEDRKVFKFILKPKDADEAMPEKEAEDFEFSRRIPTEVKRKVWERDNGKCVECGATQDLHFDHKIPWSKGGSSRVAENIQLLCAEHNLQKSDKIK